MLPRVVIHNAVSVDGRIDWFTPNIDKFYDLTSTWAEEATLAGSDTLLGAYAETQESSEFDEPFQKDLDDTRPLLIVPDSKGRLRIWHLLRKEPYWRDAVALCSESTPKEYLEYLKKMNVEYIIAGNEKVDFRGALEEINNRYKINNVRVDSGGTLNGILLRAGLVDEVSVLIHPFLVGGMTPSSLFRAADLISTEGVISLKVIKINLIEPDLIWMRFEVLK